MAMVSLSYNNLCEKDASGQVEPHIIDKIAQCIVAIQNRNLSAASLIQTVRNDVTNLCISITLSFIRDYILYCITFYYVENRT